MPLQDYDMLELLNQGGTSVVHKVRDRDTGEYFALKITPFERLSMTIWQNEINVLKKFQYVRGIIKMYEYWSDQTHGYMVVELCYGDICDYPIHDEEEQSKLFVFLIYILKHLHTSGYCYNDLKIENILRKKNGFRLCDFSSCLPLGTTSKTLYGTPSILPPELIDSFQKNKTYYYDEKIDMWGFGTVIYEIVTNRPIYDIPPHLNTAECLRYLQDCKIDFTLINNIDLRDILQQCLYSDPQQRIRIWDIERMLNYRNKNKKPNQYPRQITEIVFGD